MTPDQLRALADELTKIGRAFRCTEPFTAAAYLRACADAAPIGEVVIGEEGTTKGWTVIRWRADLPPIAVGTKLYAAPVVAQPQGEKQ